MGDVRYRVPRGQHRIEQVIDRSRFLCTVSRVQSAAEAQAFIRALNGEFPDATHHCWAYVVGPPGSTNQIGLSDDGEPHGTAGRPMLTVLLHSGVGEIAAVVTRYYGGVKLGTGGLVKAYGGAVQEALASLPTEWRMDVVLASFAVPYAHIGAVQQLLPELEAEITTQQFEVDARFTVRLPRTQVTTLTSRLQHLLRGGLPLLDVREL